LRRLIAFIIVLAVAVEAPFAFATDSKGAAYCGGTITTFNGAKDLVEGTLDTTNERALIFSATDKAFRGKTFSIPYDRVIDLEYGQKTGRRIGTAVATTVLFGPIGLVSLLSKKRKHFLTVGFKDDAGKDQVAVIEMGKDIVRVTLPIVETRSGKKVEYQDEEARNSAK